MRERGDDKRVDSFCTLSFDVSLQGDECDVDDVSGDEGTEMRAMPRVDDGDLACGRYVIVEGKRVLAVEVPVSMPEDGRSFMRFTPLASTVRLRPGGARRALLHDPASNTGLIDEELFLANSPDIKIHAGDRICYKP